MWKDTIRKSKEYVTASKRDDAVTGNISGEGVMSTFCKRNMQFKY